MAKIKQKISITDAESRLIRQEWDAERQRFYFSITDIVGILTDSVDSRNYWKALKNRLKINHNQLVMDCNQLKMKSSDGKSYMVDVADADTIIKIIQLIAPYNTPAFKAYFDHVDVKNSTKNEDTLQQNISTVTHIETVGEIFDQGYNELSTTLIPAIDIYENKNEIMIQIMSPGADPAKIIIAVNMKNLTIKGKRNKLQNIAEENHLIQELDWGEFYRKIELPSFVDIDNIVATEIQGLITIKLPKIDLDKNRFIKIKTV